MTNEQQVHEQLVHTIITGATVLSRTTRPAPDYPKLPRTDTEARGTATFLDDHAIGIRGNAIAWVKPSVDVTPAERAAATTVIDARGQVAIPGLMNSHTHSPMTMFRGSAEDVPTSEWFNAHIWPMEVNLTERDVTLGAQLAVAEMLLAGVTSFADHYFSSDRIAEVVAESGARALPRPSSRRRETRASSARRSSPSAGTAPQTAASPRRWGRTRPTP
jgi:5-methylthioadenosine/S-adenosylhomocysteine deaminase